MVTYQPGLALGTAQWGLDYGIANRDGKPSLATLEALLRVATDSGIRVLDTAHAYGDSEARIGCLVGDDARFRIVTKLSPAVGDALSPADAARRSVEESLARLRRDRIDVLLLHRPEHRHVAGGGVWEALLSLRDAGVISRLGVSALAPEDALAALDDPDVPAVQVTASVLDRRLEEASFFPRAEASGKEVFARSVFLQGAAGMRPDALPTHLGQLASPLAKLHRIAGKYDVPVHELCLRYVRSLEGAVPVVGCEHPDQLARNAEAWARGTLPPDLLPELREAVGSLPAHVLDPSRWQEQRL